MKQHKPWRLFNVPEDHVFVVNCVGDKLRLLIQSPSYNLDQSNGQVPYSCGGQPHEAWTPSIHDGESYRSLFWSRPGEERVVPFPWPLPDMWGRLMAAMVEKTWDENPPTVEEKTPPESFTIAVDEVLFYRPWRERRRGCSLLKERMWFIWSILKARRRRKLIGPAVSPLPPQSVLPLTFTDSQRARSQEGHRVKLF
jgi:hypothetical protein